MGAVGCRCGFGDCFGDGAVLWPRSDIECEVGLPRVCYPVADELECIGRFLVEAKEDECGRFGARVEVLNQLFFLEVEGSADERGDAGIVDPGEVVCGGREGG